MESKKYFLFVYLLISVNFFGLLPIANWLSINQRYILLMIMILTCFFKRNRKTKLINQHLFTKGYKIACILFIGIFGSMLSCYIFWEQELSISILTYRFTYSFLLFPALLKMKPTISDIEWTIKWGAILSLVTWIISIFFPSLVGIEANQNISEKAELGVLNRGFQFFVFYIYIMLSKLAKEFSISKLIITFFFIICLILMQNRSMLIGVLIIFSFVIFKSKEIKLKYKLLISITALIIIINDDIISIFSSLWEETTNQLKDENYNRNKALTYFLYNHSPNPLCYLLGNGIPSLGISEFGKHMEIISSNGIVTSDLGLIGCWVEFGLIPIIILLYFIFTTFSIKHIRLPYLKFIYFHMLIIPTIWGFWYIDGIFLFSIIFYLSIITLSLNKQTIYYVKSK